MKRARKVIALILCAAVLMAVSVMGTLAYLTSQAKVENTFTVGSVGIKMVEHDAENKEVQGNSYKLIPGSTYTKDPTITVDAGSEDCYLFVDVQNNISQYIDIAMAGGWINLQGTIWYQIYDGSNAAFPVFANNSFTVKTDADAVAGWSDITADNSKIIVTAYAIQLEGFENKPSEAWGALTNQLGIQ